MAALAGRVALVTGGSRGIGAAIAVSLAEAGASVAVNYLQKEREAEAVAEAVRTKGRKAIAVRADVSSSAEVAQMVSAVERELGAVDILVNKAGVGIVKNVED